MNHRGDKQLAILAACGAAIEERDIARLTDLLARVDPALEPELQELYPRIVFGLSGNGVLYRYGEITPYHEGFTLNIRGVDAAAVLSCLNAPEVPK